MSGRRQFELARRVLAPENKLPIILAENIPRGLSTQAAKKPTATAWIVLMYSPIIVPPKGIAGGTLVVTATHVTVHIPSLNISDVQGTSTTSPPHREVTFVLHVAKGQVLNYVRYAQFFRGGRRS